ncbi:general secretion pathway protein L [Pseudomonas duriflava]|uniref:General secretion pathway protein L n=1 Tax=Pseudomonas duriflava TaxID=459528 RepID=A0A562QIT0_9PSED|nr:PilN domain-containing protein [Pseudomonas duriflava]TWI56678.1 general secretion pathway protein L [Pseudomonas duriflava]
MKTTRLEWPAALRPALNALQAQWEASVFPRFFGWWLGELRACLPSRLREVIERGDEEQIVRWENDELWLQTPTGLQPYHSASVQGRCVLLLTTRQALVRTISLPSAAAQDLTAALAFELDRHTPFKANQVYYAFRRWPSPPRQSLKLTLAVATRERVDALLERASQYDVQLSAIDVQMQDGTRLGVNLLPPERRQVRHDPRRLLNRSLAVLTVILALVTLQLWLHNREAVLNTMQQEVTRLRNEAREIDELRQQLQNGLGATHYLTDRKRSTPALSVMLSELTHCLPKDTWLSEMSVESDGQVNLAGQSQRASVLIGELKKCPSLTGAQFQGVIQPDENTGKERFYLLAHLRREDVGHAPNPDAP